MTISPTSLYVGQKGYFDFHSPFDAAYHLNDMFLVIDHISAINTLVLDNVNIELVYFTAYKLSKVQYISFLNSNGVIVTFKAPNGDRYSIPNTFIKSLPNPNDIPYRQLGINIVFGPLPTDYDIEALENQLSKAILYTLGVKSSIHFAPLSPILLLPKTDTPNTPAYYDPDRIALENLNLMISAIRSFAKFDKYDIMQQAVFGGGSQLGPLSTTSLYVYSNNTSTVGGNLSYSSDGLAAAGIASEAIFGGGINQNLSTTIYTYSNNTSVAGASLLYGSGSWAAAGNSTMGVFGGGSDGNTIMSSTTTYTYAANLLSNGTNISYSAKGLAAASNGVMAIFGGGSNLNPINSVISSASLYEFSNNNALASTNLSYSVYYPGAAGNNTIAIFGGGNTQQSNVGVNSTVVYNYASNTAQIGSSLSYATYQLTGTGTSVIGIFGGGFSIQSNLSNTSTYGYSNNITTAAANLSYNTSALSAASSSNMGVIS